MHVLLKLIVANDCVPQQSSEDDGCYMVTLQDYHQSVVNNTALSSVFNVHCAVVQ